MSHQLIHGALVISPGHVNLQQWRAVLDGAPVALDPACRGAVAQSAAAVARIVSRDRPVYGVNTGFGRLATVSIARDDLQTLQRNLVLSHAVGVGPCTDPGVVKLMMAIKLASLGCGASGVRPETLDYLEAMLQRDVIPVIPRQGSVGASGDLAPLAHMVAVMLGFGEADIGSERLTASSALKRVGLTPLELAPKEGLALLNGTQFSNAMALVALLRLEVVFRTALISGALSTDATKGSTVPFDARIHLLRGHRGQIRAAAAQLALLEGSEIRHSHIHCSNVQDPYCLRCQPQVMGAILDLIQHAAQTLTTESNGVTDNPLVFASTDEVLSGGNFHAEPVAFAADQLAIAICEIGSLAERRIAMLVDPSMSGLPAFLTPNPGLNSGFMVAHVTAAALVSENKQSAFPASVDSIPTSANQEDHVSMAAHGASRLLRMVETLEHIVAIELLAAAQGCDFHAPLRSSAPLENVRACIRARVPTLDDDRFMAPDIAAATDLVRSATLIDAVAPIELPSFQDLQ